MARVYDEQIIDSSNLNPSSSTASLAESLQDTSPRSASAEIDAVRSTLTPQQSGSVDDATVARFLRAESGNAHHASRRLQDTIAWREAEQPDKLCCEACRKDPTSHYMYLFGRDVNSYPAIYSCLDLVTNRNVDDNAKHMLMQFESCVKMMKDPGNDKWLWLMDFHGFGIRDCSPKLARIFLSVSATHYPERLGTIIVIDAPTIFSTLWKAVQPFIDPVTKKKIKFVGPQPKTLGPVLREHFDAETTDWLVEEVQENRRKGINKLKRYSFPALARLAARGGDDAEVVEESEQRKSVSSSRTHDYLGSPAFIKEISGRPELLLPQIAAMADVQ